MKFSTSLSPVFVLLALLLQVSAVSVPRLALVARQAERQRPGGKNNNGGNNGGNAGGNNNGTNTGGNNNGTNTGGNNNAGNGGGGDPQTSLTLDPKVIAGGFANDGQDVPTPGQVASKTSTNNFINFCLTVPNLPLTDGKQITTGSCNPAPIGVIPSVDNMPSSKFTNPKNGATVAANKAFTITMAVSKIETGAFVNAQENYFSAPQQLNGQGQIVGHSHVVVEQLEALDQDTPTDPKKFAFFKGLNDKAVNNVLSADVTAGLPEGSYRLCSINSAANHQPVIVPIAQHGSLDDCVYFTATAGGAATGGNGAADAGANGAAGTDAAAGDTGANDSGAGAAAGANNAGGGAAAGAGAGAGTGTGTGKGGKNNGAGRGGGK